MRCSIILICIFAGPALSHTSQERESASRIVQTGPSCTALASPPSGSVCAARGMYYPNKYGFQAEDNSQIFSDLNDCLDICNQNPNCAALGYNETSQLCTAYEFNIESKDIVLDPSSDSVFTDFACYSCPVFQCPGQPGVNLVQNPGFELGAEYIGPWYTFGLSSSTDNPGPGPHTYELVSPGSNSATALRIPKGSTQDVLQQSFEVCEGEFYQLSFDYMIGPSASGQVMQITCKAGGTSGERQVLINAEPTNGTWKTFQDVFIGNFNIFDFSFISFQLNSTDADVYFDNINISIIGPTYTVKPGAANQIINGDFGTGHLRPWKFEHGKPPPHVTHKVEFVNSTSNPYYQFYVRPHPKDYGFSFNLTQTVQLVEGTRYLFQLGYNPEGPNPVTIYFQNSVSQFNNIDQGLTIPFVASANELDLTIAVFIHPRDYVELQSISILELE